MIIKILVVSCSILTIWLGILVGIEYGVKVHFASILQESDHMYSVTYIGIKPYHKSIPPWVLRKRNK